MSDFFFFFAPTSPSYRGSSNQFILLTVIILLTTWYTRSIFVFVWILGGRSEDQDFSATPVVLLSKALKPLCSRSAVSWLTLCSALSLITNWDIWKNFTVLLMHMWQIKASFLWFLFPFISLILAWTKQNLGQLHLINANGCKGLKVKSGTEQPMNIKAKCASVVHKRDAFHVALWYWYDALNVCPRLLYSS